MTDTPDLTRDAKQPLKQSSVAQSSVKSIDIKGNMYTLMSVVLRVTNLAEIKRDLQERVRQAPAFFRNTPVIVDFSNVRVTAEFDFNSLFKIIRELHLLPVAVRGIEEMLSEKFQDVGVPIVELASTGRSAPEEKTQKLGSSRTVIVDRPVSAGQQCISETGDLVLLAGCNTDAELIADGNIHVYGTLRGRAMCGVHGDVRARIFCSALAAKMVSVAGHYKVLEEIPDSIRDKPVQIRLENTQLIIEPLL